MRQRNRRVFLYVSIRDGRNVNGRLLELAVWSLERHIVIAQQAINSLLPYMASF